MSLCPTDKEGRGLVARRNLCQLLEAHPCPQQPQHHNQPLGLRITLPSTEYSQARLERLESHRSNGTRFRCRPSHDNEEYAFLGNDNEEEYNSGSQIDDEEDATSSISSGRDSMFYGGSSGSEEGDELQHQQLGVSVPGIGSFYVKRDQVLRRRRRDFVKLKRSQKAKIVKTAYSVIEAVCETFFPGERMELLDAITGAHKTYRRRHQNSLLVGGTLNTTNSSSIGGNSSRSAISMVSDKKQQNASPPCTPPAPAILRAPGTRRTRVSSLPMSMAEDTRNPDPEASSLSSPTLTGRVMTHSTASASGSTTSSMSLSCPEWHRQSGRVLSSLSSSLSGLPSKQAPGKRRALSMNMECEGEMETIEKSSLTSYFPSFIDSMTFPSSSSSPSNSMVSSSQMPKIQSMQSNIVPSCCDNTATATAADSMLIPPSSSRSPPRTAVSSVPSSSRLPSPSSPCMDFQDRAAGQDDRNVPEEAWILHGLRFAAGAGEIIEC